MASLKTAYASRFIAFTWCNSVTGVIEDLKSVPFTTDGTLTTGNFTWNGNVRKYFETTANDTFNFNGLRYTATQPAVVEDDADGMSAFIICAGASAASNNSPFICIASGSGSNNGLKTDLAGKGKYEPGAGTQPVTTASIPTDNSTGFMLLARYRSNDEGNAVFYGPMGGTLVKNTAAADGGFGGSRTLFQIGGAVGNGNQPFKCIAAGVMNNAITDSEAALIYADFQAELIDMPASGASLAQLERQGRGAFRGQYAVSSEHGGLLLPEHTLRGKRVWTGF